MSCDIIIPVWSQLKVTRECIESIIKHTRHPYGLIIIDNGSDKTTSAYLKEVASESGSHVIWNKDNKGFIKAVNQGIKESKAPYVCVLNNDTIVTEGWLGELVSIAKKGKDIGIVNPSSNNLGQHTGVDKIDVKATELKKLSGAYEEMGSCLGFCMLIKRETIKKVGLFDEIYDRGNFEETDYCRRAVKSGYICVRAKGAYVYHHMKTSFLKIKNYEESFRKNQDIFNKRWGRPKRVLYIVTKKHGKLSEWMSEEAYKKARNGNWVWFFFKDQGDIPSMGEHSNIKLVNLPGILFEWNCLFRILKKKKKFDSIYSDNTDLIDKIKKYGDINKTEAVLMGG